MAVTKTSLSAYASVNVAARQSDVFKCVKRHGPCSDQDIAAILGWTINRVTPRRGELVALNLIKKSGSAVGPNGRRVFIWEKV